MKQVYAGDQEDGARSSDQPIVWVLVTRSGGGRSCNVSDGIYCVFLICTISHPHCHVQGKRA